MPRESELLNYAVKQADQACSLVGAYLRGAISFLLLSLLCCGLAVFARLPNYPGGTMGHPKWFSDVLDWQTRNPLQKLPLAEMIDPAHRYDGWASHLNKRDTRQLLPLLGKITGLHFLVYQVANHFAAVFFFGALAYVIRNVTNDPG